MFVANPQPGAEADAGTLRSSLGARPRGVTALLAAIAVYLLFALIWSAAGRRDVDFARAAAAAAACGAAAAFVIAIQAWLGAQAGRERRRGWLWVVAAAAAACATAIAGLVVIWEDGIALWRPEAIRWIDAGSAVSLAIGVALLVAGGGMFERALARLASLAIAALLLTTAVLLLAQPLFESGPGRWQLLPLVITVAAAAPAALMASQFDRRRPETGLSLGLAVAALAWLATPLVLEIGMWSDAPGVVALARWLLPTAALGLAAALVAPAAPLTGDGRFTNRASLADSLETVTGMAASITLPAGAALAAATAGSPLAADLGALAGVVALLHAGRLLLDLRLERARVASLLETADQLERLANVDRLTGLPNRAALDQRLDEEFERAVRYEQPLSLCYVDIDYFKSVNDRFGHAAGDLVLRRVAERLDRTARSIDFVGRYGGEEFIVVAPGTWTADARILGERLRNQVQQIMFETGAAEQLRLSISVGIAGYPEHAATLDTLVERADQALYRAKAAGRNRVVLWSTADDE